MTKWTADTSEIARWSREIAKLPVAFKEAVYNTIDTSIADLEATVQRSIPESADAPHLRNSIKIVEGNPDIHERSVTVGDAALDYAIPLEFGHANKDGSHTPGNPFFIPSARVVNKRHKGRMKRSLRAVFRKFYPKP